MAFDMSRSFIFAGGLAGAAGVALSAAAAHTGGHDIGIAASFLVMHAPALLAIGLFPRNRLLAAGGAILLVGLLLFCGDLAMRDFAGHRLFPMAAPIGGSALILGWLVVAASAFSRQGSLGKVQGPAASTILLPLENQDQEQRQHERHDQV